MVTELPRTHSIRRGNPGRAYHPYHTVPLNYNQPHHAVHTATSNPTAIKINSLTILDAQESTSLKQFAHQPVETNNTIQTDRVGLLYYTLPVSPQFGISLALASSYDRLLTLAFMIDTGSQINVINQNDVTTLM